MLLVAKIEKKFGVKAIEQIIKEADAINLVRNSLCNDFGEERLVIVKDNILATCKTVCHKFC